MKYCRNKIIDRKIRECEASIAYWSHVDYWDISGEGDYPERKIRAYMNAVRRLEKLKK